MASIASELNVANPDEAFKNAFTREPYNIPVVRNEAGSDITPTLQTLEKRIYAGEDDLPEGEKAFRGMVKRSLAAARDPDVQTDAATKEVMAEMEQKGVIDATVAQNSVPLVYDPEVLDLLKVSAPLAMGRLPTEGQEGYKAVYNNITAREAPIGYVSESASANILDQAKDVTMSRGEVDMAIYVDSVSITDFSAQAAAHYVNLEDLALGARLGEYAQLKEQTVLYGQSVTPTNAVSGGSADANAFEGLAKIYADAGNTKDKSAYDLAANDLIDDVKAEIKALLQGPNAVNKADLEIWTSWTVHDRMEGELTTLARHGTNDDSVDYGHGNIRINGVEVIPSHNVDEHVVGDDGAGGDVTVGSEGDVFIVNTRATRFRQLSPLSTIPLGTRGLADEVALFEYGALIDRADGAFGAHLQAYSV